MTGGERPLPTGTVTLLFTDIEGSTRMLQELGREAYVRALSEHRRLLREAFTSQGGVEVEMQGDSFHFSFPFARDAVAAAVAAQRTLAEHVWEAQPLRVRIGLHTGEPMQADGLYAGLDVHRAARVMSAGRGGQVRLSERTADLVEGELPEGVSLRDLGEHRLKDFATTQRLFQLAIDGAPNTFPVLKTLTQHPTNLPVRPNAFVGRERERAEVTRRLRAREPRLLTLTGPGGAGKTRLALEAAAELVDAYQDGVFFVSLAALSDSRLLRSTISRGLGLREQAADEATSDPLYSFLAGSELLLVLDNVERVVEAGAELSAMLHGSPGLSVLVTSREPIRISEEQTYAVAPLGAPPVATTTTAAEAVEYEAVRLFVERARATRADFELTDENAQAVAAVCARLEGLPLAVELAAARVRVLSPEAIERRLSRPLKLLVREMRDAAPRQQTLRATIDWSYDLLNEDEKTLFACLSVFVGGFRVEAADAVVDQCRVGIEIFDGLTSLLEKSLLYGTDDADGEPRFWMLETIREYAFERLEESDECETLQEAHARYFTDLVELAADASPDEEDARSSQVESEQYNLSVAIQRAEAHGWTSLASAIRESMAKFWSFRRRALFDAWSVTYLPSRDERFPFGGYNEVLDQVAARVAERMPQRVLELGVGTGNLTRRLRARLPDSTIVGLDFSTQMRARAAPNLSDVELLAHDLRELPLPPAAAGCDVAAASYVLHEFDDDYKVQLIVTL